MSETTLETAEVQRQKRFLSTSVGVPGSGGMRYAAAMYFYMQKSMPSDMLEIYRCCSKFDHEDPIDLARYMGVELPPIVLAIEECGV